MGYDNNGTGAGWKKTSDKGVPYISCQLEHNGEKIYFSLFKNDRKTEDKHPDYNILVSNKSTKKIEDDIF